MKRQIWGVCLAILFVAIGPLLSQSNNPLSEADLITLLRNYVPPARVAELAREKGINFTVTNQVATELKQAGGDNALIESLRDLGAVHKEISGPRHVGSLEEVLAKAKDAYTGKDYANAIQLYRIAADKGSASAMLKVGSMYERGEGVDRDYSQSFQWYSKAAAAGDGDAMNSIGEMYIRGENLPQSYSQGLEWFRKAAASGNNDAMRNIGRAYENGLGVEQNLNIARDWYKKATNGGNSNAKDDLAALEARIQRLQIAADTAKRWPSFKKATEAAFSESESKAKNAASTDELFPAERAMRGLTESAFHFAQTASHFAAFNAECEAAFSDAAVYSGQLERREEEADRLGGCNISWQRVRSCTEPHG